MAPVCVRVAFVGGGPGGLRAGPDRMGRIALRGGRPGLLRTKTEKLRGGHEGVRIGPPAGRVGRGRASMADARRLEGVFGIVGSDM